MNKVIKIQNNIDKSMSYNADNIEAVLSGDMQQKVQFQTTDEYNLPVGTYLTLRNYDNILFDAATQQTDDKTYAIVQSETVPDCEYMYNLYNTYVDSSGKNDCKGVVAISTSEEIYNQIVVSYKQLISGDEQSPSIEYRITDIYLDGEYSTLAEATRTLEDDNPVILDFDEIYSKCARYWKIDDNNKKTSVFDSKQSTKSLPSFDGGYGEYKYVPGSDTSPGEEYNAEYWRSFTNQTSNYVIPNGNHYLTSVEEESFEAKDSNYNIFDVLFRSIYDYLYIESEETSGSGTETSPSVMDPSSYTFLLKTYKMYAKSSNGSSSSSNSLGNSLGKLPNIGNIISLDPIAIGVSSEVLQEIAESTTSYSTKVLTLDEIKELSAEDAQEYFNNTIVYDNQEYLDRLVLSETEAKEVLLSKNINKCGNYFLISSNVGIKSPSTQQYEYCDLGNFELSYSGYNKITRKNYKYIYKYNTNGQVIRVRQIYDPYNDETYNISKNNAGEFDEGYVISRKGVLVRGVSGTENYFYFEDSSEGRIAAEQLKEDILYAMEDGPSIVMADSLLDIY